MDPAPTQCCNAWRQGLALWLLLLSIFTHALVPAGSPLQRMSGSAFSATTAEVAIAPKRKGPGAEQVELRDTDSGSQGAAAADDPPSLFAGGAVSSAWAQQPAKLSRQPVTSRPPAGGAAPFSARAPPSI